MVILRRRQKIKQLEAGIEEAKAMFRTFVTEQRAYNKANDIQVKELEEMVNNLADDNNTTKSAQTLLREYLYGEEDK